MWCCGQTHQQSMFLSVQSSFFFSHQNDNLDTSYSYNCRYEVVGRSLFHHTFAGDAGLLTGGLEYWRGYYQSLRPTQMGLALNIGMNMQGSPGWEFYICVWCLFIYFFNFFETNWITFSYMFLFLLLCLQICQPEHSMSPFLFLITFCGT